MNDSQILDRIIDRYFEEANGDPTYMVRLMAYDINRLGGGCSAGFHRVRCVPVPGFNPKPQVEAIDIPAANTPQAASPNS